MTDASCPSSPSAGHCSCINNATNGVVSYWGGNQCQTCQRTCLNQGSIDALCTTCTCPAGVTGPTCNLFYALIQIQLVGLPTTSFSSNPASLSLFSNLLASDIAYALGLPSAQVKVTSATLLSSSSVQVQFQLISTAPLGVQASVSKFKDLVATGGGSLQTGQVSSYIDPNSAQDVTYSDPTKVTLPIAAVVGIAVGAAIIGAIVLALVVRYACQMKLRRATMMAKTTTNIQNTTSSPSNFHQGPRPPPPRNVQVSI